MEDPKIQEEYKKRSQTVEPPFGVLKQYKDLNTVKVTEKNNVETRTGYKIAGYNLRRLENIMKNDNKNRDKILDLIKKNYKRKYIYKNFNNILLKKEDICRILNFILYLAIN